MTGKVCSRCKEKKPLQCFGKIASATGKLYYRGECHMCRSDVIYKYKQDKKHKLNNDLLHNWQ